MKVRKLLLLLAALAVIITALIVPPVLTYYTATEEIPGVVTSGNIEYIIHNELSSGSAAPEQFIVIPGDEVDRRLFVENVGQQPFYLRVKLVCTLGQQDATGYVEPCAVDSNWTLVDGYYYYNTVLEPGQVSSALFTRLLINGNKVDQTHIGQTLTFRADVETVQSKNNPADHPWDAAGWPAA